MAFHSFDTGRSGGAGAPHRPMSDINVTPLVDVMLVLLVIFILTAPLMTSAIRLDLPQTAAARPAGASPHQVVLVLDKQGVVHLDDVPQSPDALRRRLQEVAKVHPDTEVQLRADAQAAYGRLVEVIGIAQQAGLSRIGFVADGLPPERNP
jgi:biopolymer transport protein TolR